MKKMFCTAVAAIMILALAACGSTTGSESESQATDGSTTQTTTEATEGAVDTAVFEQITLVDDENATVKLTAIDADNFWGYTLKVFLENKTDKELMFTVESVSVNGFMCDPFWAASVAPGMKANEEISFSESDFEDNGIETVEEIVFTLRVFDSENFLSDDLVNETITVKP